MGRVERKNRDCELISWAKRIQSFRCVAYCVLIWTGLCQNMRVVHLPDVDFMTAVNHRQLAELGEKHFGSMSLNYEREIPSLPPARFTGSEVEMPLASISALN